MAKGDSAILQQQQDEEKKQKEIAMQQEQAAQAGQLQANKAAARTGKKRVSLLTLAKSMKLGG